MYFIQAKTHFIYVLEQQKTSGKEGRRNASTNACTKVANKKSQSHVLLVARAAIGKVLTTSSPCSLPLINAPTLEK